ncbi:MAG: lactate utilization protein [Pseudomonadota bacterium]
MTARARILQKLCAVSVAKDAALPDVHAFYRAEKQQQSAQTQPSVAQQKRQKIAQFCRQLRAAHAEVIEVSALNWPALVRAYCEQNQIANLLYGAHGVYGATLSAALAPSAQHPAAKPQLKAYAEVIDTWKDSLFEHIAAGFSSARGGIVDTGSLILWPDAHEPRALSLVPPVHFALLDANKLYANLAEAMAQEAWYQGLPSNVLLISGPSKTADIQTTLAYGAHGPKTLVVLLMLPDDFYALEA